ncbi:MAG: LysR family transcriptional regulator [Lachnospiraceae bacterium]|nr:LysR family transcriptional regulator [Lachnospiraceae bacterium]
MELRHLRYFLVLAEEMNFTRAADRLMIAQPPLSRQIKDLEEELGTPLFVRGHHLLELTEEGALFRDYASRILSLADQSVAEIQDMGSGLQGTLYLAEVEGKGPHLMSQWISGFSKLYPGVQFSLWNGNSDEVVNRIHKGLGDIGLIMEPYDPKGIHSLKVYSEPWVAMIPADHPLAAKASNTISMKELRACDLIIPSRDSRLREISDQMAPYGATPHVKAKIANVLTAYELCKAGVGVAIYPAAAADIVSDPNKVVIKTIADKGIRASYVLIYSDAHPLQHIAQKFIEYIHEQGADMVS